MTEVWTDGGPYERYVGRWSRQVAPKFLDWLPDAPGAAWCDVGCGTGALSHAILATRQPVRVVGVDPSEGFLGVAIRNADGPFEGRVGSATDIPAGDSEFDRVVGGLMLNFVPDYERAMTEMRRIAKPGGYIGVYVWAYAEGMEMMRLFWDAAITVDENALELDEGPRFPVCRPGGLTALFSQAGLADVKVEGIEIPTVFADFDDYWQPFLGGQGAAPAYFDRLDEYQQVAIRERLRAALPKGEIALTARAWAAQGRT
ncbi:class I SAM-dependent methyltransferase [Tenggerimyces flavus]|uniref:Class I SAM-dependent methyltransferase n=1 Tax=Tenggerimyces flavus TaxID=1708749 RepID=A0ABV7Y9M7_9ACTN|nr:class I SAM-dependent methyltransferase [Tenggerimyces flavus]MBM7791131.1 SAM-dependent methyltransferase [Tenggerimyces flavus]